MAIDPSAEVHPTAVVEPGAEIGAGCRDRPLLRDRPRGRARPRASVLHSHVAVAGAPAIGEGTMIFPFASIGHVPQDLNTAASAVELIIGARNRIREHATMNPGTAGGGGVTRVGDDNLFMMSTHVAHDCIDRQPRHHGQQRHPRRPLRRRGLRDPRRALGGAPVRAARPRRDDRRPGRRGRRRHPLRLGDRRARAPRRPEPRRPEARAAPSATTSTACAPPSARCSRARARCRSARGAAGARHAGNPLVREIVASSPPSRARSFTLPPD